MQPDSESSVPCPVLERWPRSHSGENGKIIQFTSMVADGRTSGELNHELTHAELTGELSEFYALLLRAIVAMIEEAEPDFVLYYLEMANTVAMSCVEQSVVKAHRSIYESAVSENHTAAQRCLAVLESMCQKGSCLAS